MAKYRSNRIAVDIKGEKEWKEGSFEGKERHTGVG